MTDINKIQGINEELINDIEKCDNDDNNDVNNIEKCDNDVNNDIKVYNSDINYEIPLYSVLPYPIIKSKSILKQNKNPQDLAEDDDKIKIVIVKFIAILFVAIVISPFIICDLLFGYTDDSCVDIYPQNLNFINMKIYLLVSGYYVIGLLSIIAINWYFISDSNEGVKIVLVAGLSILSHISKVFLILWNIIGAIIFWGTLNKRNYCSKSTNTYLFVSLILKLLLNFYNVMSTNNKRDK
jgi:hypothetical protein